MFLHLSVSHSVHKGGGQVWQGGVWGACMVGGAWQGGVCGGGVHGRGRAWGHAWWGCAWWWVAGGVRGGGVHGRGRAWGRAWWGCAWWWVAGGVRGGWGACVVGGVRIMHVPQHHKIRLVNARAVRILLECILVFIWQLRLKRHFWPK